MSASRTFDVYGTIASLEALARDDIEEARDTALYAAGVERGADSQNVAPKPPIEWGDLRGSMHIQVSGHRPVGTGKPGNYTQPPSDGLRGGTVRVSYCTSYAARLELSPHWRPNEKAERREPGRIGSNWLGKTNAFGAKYQKVFSEVFARELSERASRRRRGP